MLLLVFAHGLLLTVAGHLQPVFLLGSRITMKPNLDLVKECDKYEISLVCVHEINTDI